MSKDRQAPCVYYMAFHECAKHVTDGADINGKCKTCKKYMPRKGFRAIDKRREQQHKSNKIDY